MHAPCVRREEQLVPPGGKGAGGRGGQEGAEWRHLGRGCSPSLFRPELVPVHREGGAAVEAGGRQADAVA
eukprot:scaffold11939_cov73-Phaeocystis_antarctica.AAC.6